MPRYVRPKWRSHGRPLTHDEHSVSDDVTVKDTGPSKVKRRRRRMSDTLSDDVWLADECPCVECDNTYLLRVDYLSDYITPPIDPLSVDQPSVDTPSESE